MSIVNAAGEITSLSISQVEKADEKQTGGCLRKWWFEVPQGLKPEQSYAKNEGTAGHELLRRYLLTGENPKGRTLMGKAVTGAILKGELPAPGDDLIVERRFSGQPMRDESRCECGHALDQHGVEKRSVCTLAECTCTDFRPAWIPLDTAETLILAGVPWDGAIDLVHRRGPRPVVLDHKFSSDPDMWAKKSSELIKTVQMPVYAHSQRPYYPDAREFELVHHYVSKKGVLSFMRRAVVTVEQIDERIADVIQVIERMRAAARCSDQNDVPARATEERCSAWGGCAHQSICSAFKKRSTNPGAKPMALTAAEQAIFDSIPAGDAPADAEAIAEITAAQISTPPPADETDAEDAALQKQLADAQAALEAKKAKRKMKMIDTDASGAPIVPPPPAPEPEQPAPVCPCGEKLTPENGSKLQGGSWKHIGCKLDQAPPPIPKPRAGKKADAPPPPPPPAPTPLAPKAFAGERESDRAARAAMDAAARAKPDMENAEASRPVSEQQPAPGAVGTSQTWAQIAALAPVPQMPPAPALTQAVSDNRAEIVAQLFTTIAALLRAA